MASGTQVSNELICKRQSQMTQSTHTELPRMWHRDILLNEKASKAHVVKYMSIAHVVSRGSELNG